MFSTAFAIEQKNIIHVPFSENPPIIDGQWSKSDEWNDAVVTSVGNDSDVFYILAKHDKSHVYFMIDLINEQDDAKSFGMYDANNTLITARSAAGVCFDTHNDGGEKMKNDDFCFVGYEVIRNNSANSTIFVGDSLIGIHPPEEYKFINTFSNKNDPYESMQHNIYEIQVPISDVKNSSNFGFATFVLDPVSDGTSRHLNWPYSSGLRPNTWGLIEISNHTMTSNEIEKNMPAPKSIENILSTLWHFIMGLFYKH